MTAKYRDLAQLVSFGLQLFMYATPIIYSLHSLPKKYQQILCWNPLSSLFEAFKQGCLDCGDFSVGGLLYTVAVTLISLLLSVLVFSRVERNFMDTI
jgi:lipopolysaccharide transport system permease protein